MGKPNHHVGEAAGTQSQESTAADAAPVTIVRATPDNPMPAPPHGGQWERQKNGDLHLIKTIQYLTPDQRREARMKDQATSEAARLKAARTDTRNEE